MVISASMRSGMCDWFGLALALRGVQISDFPLCNKSFNLSYAGHDLRSRGGIFTQRRRNCGDSNCEACRLD